MPTRLLVTLISVPPPTMPSVTRYGVCPDSDTAVRASSGISAARRRPSAVATPCPLKRSEPSGWVPPSNVASPPSTRAAPLAIAKPRCENSTRPRAPPSIGMSGLMRTSLSASATLPWTVLRSTSASGMRSASFRSAAPVAVACASAPPVHLPTGERLMKRSASASGPRPLPSTASTGPLTRSAIVALTFDSSKPPSRPCASRTCIERAVEHQFAVDVRQAGPRRGPRRLVAAARHARHVVERHVVQLGGDAELALLRVVEREVPQVAFHPEGRVAQAARLHRALDISARRLRDAERQVARGGRGACAVELGRQVELPGKASAACESGARAGAPRAVQFARGIGIRKPRVLHLQFDARRHVGLRCRIDAPGQLRAELLQCHFGPLEDAGELQGPIGDRRAWPRRRFRRPADRRRY